MHIRIILFGKPKESFINDALDKYTSLIKHYAKLEIIFKKDNKSQKINLSDLKNFTPATSFILDEQGKKYDTLGFAGFLKSSQLTLIIGNAFGFENEVKSKYKAISLSSLTYNHELATVMLLEQIYRALNINAGGSYNK